MNIDPLKELTLISVIVPTAFVVVTSKSLPLATVPDVIAYSKANPDRFNYASVNNPMGIVLDGSGALFVALLGLLGVEREAAFLLSVEVGVLTMLASLPGAVLWLMARQPRNGPAPEQAR